MQKMDKKYQGTIFKNDGSWVPPEEWIVFRAKDKALVPMLNAYLEECIRLGCDMTHRDGIENLIESVESFQQRHPCRTEIPDTAERELLE